MKAAEMGVLLGLILPLWGQEPTFMEAGTHPGAGQNYSRAVWFEGGTLFKHAYGFTARRALLGDLRLSPSGLSEAGLRYRQRVWQRDTGPIDTWRASLQAGMSWQDGRDPGPGLGVVSTTIRRRHGINLQADVRAGLAGEERFVVNASHVYRIHPVRYRIDTPGAWYTMVESLNRLSTDGELDGDLAAGLLYEARRWAAEISLRWLKEDTVRAAAGLRMLW